MRLRPWAAGVTLVVVLVLACALTPTTSNADSDLWAQLQHGGLIVLMRHASTEVAYGDPPGARLDDCTTQRNLNDAGRAEARKIGDVFKAHGVPIGKVLSSRFCRCKETATLAFGRVEPNPALDNYFDQPERRDKQQSALRKLLIEPVPAGENLVLVSHGINIRPLAGAQPEMGEFFVIAPDGKGGFRVLGRIAPADLR